VLHEPALEGDLPNTVCIALGMREVLVDEQASAVEVLQAIQLVAHRGRNLGRQG